jgi:UDP-N-acetylglucosamine transferase subunit ALG13
VIRIDFLLVTVGTTGFDELVEAVDTVVGRFDVRDGLVQYGPGRHVPRSLPSERFVPSLDPYYEKATLVIAHGGAGTAFEVVGRGLPLVGVANDDRYDHHQDDVLGALSRARHLVWCRDLSRLEDAVAEAMAGDLVPLPREPCGIADRIDRHLAAVRPRRRLRLPWRLRPGRPRLDSPA